MFRFCDVPENRTVIEHIKDHLDWDEAIERVGGFSHELITSPLKVLQNSQQILDEVYELYADLGAVHWQSQPTCELYGLSLSYNWNAPYDTWKLGSFGHSRYRSLGKKGYFSAVEKDIAHGVRGDYVDSMAFRHLHPNIVEGSALHSLLTSFAAPVHRVTARTINGNMIHASSTNSVGMHKDGNQFESLRINVCLSNNGNFGLQYEGQEPYFPNPGDVSFVNTDVTHRAYATRRCDFQRTHLVINLSPWLNYDPVNDSWEPNEFYGKVHPVDMVKQGLIFKPETPCNSRSLPSATPTTAEFSSTTT